MSSNTHIKKLLAAAITTAIYVNTATAAEFYFGENDDISLQITSQLSIGSSWRMEAADPSYIGATNGGTGYTATTDDGNLNFDKNDAFSQIVKGSHDFNLSKGDFGAFVRVKYWHDFELADGDRPHGNSGNGYTPGEPLSDEGFAEFGQFSGVKLMDAYLYGAFDIGDAPVDVRLGRQVVSWGESTFIQGGLNSTNPFDVNALRRPGASLKEGLLPVGMLFVNAGVTENLSIEAFYQYEWEKTQIDGCGTFFSGADFAADGCNYVTVGADNDQTAVTIGSAAKRLDDIEPDDGGQYGVAFRYFAPELNDTEFGFYYMNIHSRLPLINAVRGSWKGINPALPVFLPWANAVGLDAAYPTLAAGAAAGVLTPEQQGQFGVASVLQTTGTDRATIDALNPGYKIEFPEDLKYYGVSFATNVAGFALSGEVSYKPDTPIQISGPEILNAVLSEQPFLRYSSRILAVEPGEYSRGWDEFDVTQLQITALQFFDRVMGASRLTVIAEAGVILTDGVEDSNQNYGRNSVFGLGDFDIGNGINCSNLVASGALSGDCIDDGYVTDTAWGYRVRAQFEYPNAFAGVSLSPTIDWQHDVSGYSPDPGQQFNEGARSFGVSLEAAYQQTYTASLSYKAFSGGDYNIMSDKDFVALSIGISY
ncbi:DUF1302 domain-containing protein [uncultured Paraglaciecola sp.]|uniref:DUF1302 domain-containing protein n=1 Tax=uncultured Paraglaciecola sp. TaxID=1765024 RepID=UPI002623D9A8|nr:DUF1302 domain-containing protein [uncultured Paraglaciecola sp.]